jgi:release factor glutamine methyltransferase
MVFLGTGFRSVQRDEYMKFLDLLKYAKEHLAKTGIENPAREGETILSHCLNTDRAVLYRDNPDIPESRLTALYELLKRRAQREPLQYILGYDEFYNLKIKVGPGVLIPRPETELLVEEAVAILTKSGIQTAELRILDLCTGSGCIALALAAAFPKAQVYGTDISTVALHYAKENAEFNKIHNINFIIGNLFEPLGSTLLFDLIISNPPYIKQGDLVHLQPEITGWEPVEALDGGEDGLDYYRFIIAGAGHHLHENGFLMLELGIDQSDPVKQMAEHEGFREIILKKDFAGIDRILLAKSGKV